MESSQPRCRISCLPGRNLWYAHFGSAHGELRSGELSGLEMGQLAFGDHGADVLGHCIFPAGDIRSGFVEEEGGAGAKGDGESGRAFEVRWGEEGFEDDREGLSCTTVW